MTKLRTTAVAFALLMSLVGCGRSNAPTTVPAPASPSPSSTPNATVTSTPSATTAPTAPPTGPKPTATTPKPPFPASLRGKDVERIPSTSKIVALTFDAGANADSVNAILATLDREHVKATFFLTGDFVTRYPEQSRRIAAAGHRIGSHSVDHPYFTGLSDAQIRSQLARAETAIRGATGANPAPLFRFPYGDRNARTIAAVNAAGYVPVRWTVDSLGWQGTRNGTRDATFVAQRVLAAAVAGGDRRDARGLQSGRSLYFGCRRATRDHRRVAGARLHRRNARCAPRLSARSGSDRLRSRSVAVGSLRPWCRSVRQRDMEAWPGYRASAC